MVPIPVLPTLLFGAATTAILRIRIRGVGVYAITSQEPGDGPNSGGCNVHLLLSEGNDINICIRTRIRQLLLHPLVSLSVPLRRLKLVPLPAVWMRACVGRRVLHLGRQWWSGRSETK
jgi:hypothetical protein